MTKKITGVIRLFEYLNKSRFDQLDDEIAKFFFEHRDQISSHSMREMADMGYFSQSSLTRFFKKNGAATYQDFKIGCVFDTVWYDNYLATTKKNGVNKSLSQIKEDIASQMHDSINEVAEIPVDQIVANIELFAKYRRIIFIGSEFSVGLVYGLQGLLVAKGKNCYAISDVIGQEAFIKTTNENDLIICISIEQRWYRADHSTGVISALHESKAHKVLWTIAKNHKDHNKFDGIFHFGNHINDYGYNQLVCLIPVLIQYYLQINE